MTESFDGLTPQISSNEQRLENSERLIGDLALWSIFNLFVAQTRLQELNDALQSQDYEMAREQFVGPFGLIHELNQVRLRDAASGILFTQEQARQLDKAVTQAEVALRESYRTFQDPTLTTPEHLQAAAEIVRSVVRQVEQQIPGIMRKHLIQADIQKTESGIAQRPHKRAVLEKRLQRLNAAQQRLDQDYGVDQLPTDR